MLTRVAIRGEAVGESYAGHRAVIEHEHRFAEHEHEGFEVRSA
jgi:hypothetical protein